MSETMTRPPRDNLVRAEVGGYELRGDDEAAMPTLTGHFAVFDKWTEIASMSEGHFLERIAPGAFASTLAEHRDNIKVTFNHGQDPSMGDKVLGTITNLLEDNVGARYDVNLLDTSYNRDLLPGLEAGLYGSSFRFSVLREDVERSPERSDHNPDAITERTITKARVYEFGPVTFPAYADATAGVRSLTDEYVFGRFASNPEALVHLIDYVRSGEVAPTVTEPERADTPAAPAKPTAAPPRFRTREEFLAWMSQS